MTFKDMLLESKAGKNLHLEHLEDEIINFGVPGGRAAINFLRSLRDMLAGASRSSVNMTVKWDGAPAIFCGLDPSDGKFFVAKNAMLIPIMYGAVAAPLAIAFVSLISYPSNFKFKPKRDY